MNPFLLDAEPDFLDSPDGLIVRKQQLISSNLLNEAHEARADDTGHYGEFREVASIPTLVVEIWKQQGFDIHEHSAHEIVKRLHQQDLQAFITTTKSV